MGGNMKKITFIIIVSLLCINSVCAKTVGDLKKELAETEKEYADNKAQTALTKEQMEQVKSNIESIKNEIKQATSEIQNMIAESEKLNEEIDKMDKEMKSIMNFVQIAGGESSYLEYIMGAKSFTDFIYRISVSEQMVNYNDELTEKYNKKIKEYNKKQEELKEKQISLGEKQKELELEMAKLGEKLSDLSLGKLDLADQIKAQKEALQAYSNCADNQDIKTCGVPTGTTFSRPLTSGTVTSEYGNRYHPTQGVWRLHSGIDIAKPGSSVPIYATANGKVAAVTRRSSCGGNVIYIHHNIGGVNYTSVYMHLRSINVSVGQVVTATTQIATMGGNPAIEYWDRCSTGQHLHFTVARGLYFIDYSSYSSFEAHTFNPRQVVSFPGTWGSFNSRL